MSIVGAQPASSTANLYIGQNGRGQWIVTDGVGHCGGVFTQRKDALQFAMSRHHTSAVFMVPVPIALSFGPPIRARSLAAYARDSSEGSGETRLDRVCDGSSRDAEARRR